MHTRFSKFCALLAIAGLFYVGHGLHQRGGGDGQFPSLTNMAQADDITSVSPANGGYGHFYVVTSSPDRREIHVWKLANSTGKPAFVGSAQAALAGQQGENQPPGTRNNEHPEGGKPGI